MDAAGNRTGSSRSLDVRLWVGLLLPSVALIKIEGSVRKSQQECLTVLPIRRVSYEAMHCLGEDAAIGQKRLQSRDHDWKASDGSLGVLGTDFGSCSLLCSLCVCQIHLETGSGDA